MNHQNHGEQRKSPRAKFHNYSGGEYFVTICTAEKQHFFGDIRNGEMVLSPIGEFCNRQLEMLSEHYPYATVSLHVVMPNHIHALIAIADSPQASDTVCARTHEPCVPTVRTALSVVVGGLKRAVTMFARRNEIEFEWQSRYHDHIVRNQHEGDFIAEYIINNPTTWAEDCFAQ